MHEKACAKKFRQAPLFCSFFISDQFFNKTLANMKANPQAAITFWEGHEGYQLKGNVTIETSGQRYEDTVKWTQALSEKAGFLLKSTGAVRLHIKEVFGVSPGPGAGKQLA